MSQNNKTQLHFQSGYYPSPLCSYKEYRGSARRAKGLEYKQDPPIPPLSGGEVARETEEKWARTVRAKRVPQTPTATVATSQKPDNRGGASWFVLLAAEKNEQIKRINVTRTFFDWERKLLVSNLLPLPCPEALRGVVQENIGEN